MPTDGLDVTSQYKGITLGVLTNNAIQYPCGGKAGTEDFAKTTSEKMKDSKVGKPNNAMRYTCTLLQINITSTVSSAMYILPEKTQEQHHHSFFHTMLQQKYSTSQNLTSINTCIYLTLHVHISVDDVANSCILHTGN